VVAQSALDVHKAAMRVPSLELDERVIRRPFLFCVNFCERRKNQAIRTGSASNQGWRFVSLHSQGLIPLINVKILDVI
jgi:hypothetical protein